MADNKAPEAVAAPAPTVAPSQGPAAATPLAAAPSLAVEPVALSSPAPAPVTASDAPPSAPDSPAAAPDDPTSLAAPQQETVPEAPKGDGTLLGEAKTSAPEGEKPAEVKAEAPKTEEVKAPLPTFEKFTLPEGVTLQDDKVAQFTNILGEFELSTKADHAAVQAFGQKAVELYTAEAQDLVQRLQTNQVDTWNRTRDGWKENFRKDPEIGGNRQQTTIRQCAAVIELYGAKMGAEKETALREAFRVTGIGDHPEMIRFINWASKFSTERARPVAAVVPKQPVSTSRATRRYPPQGA